MWEDSLNIHANGTTEMTAFETVFMTDNESDSEEEFDSENEIDLDDSLPRFAANNDDLPRFGH